MEIDRGLLRRYIRESETWRVVEREFVHPVHAYLLMGEDKETMGELVDLVCTRVYCPTACGHCVECRKVLGHNKLDVKYVNEWGAKTAVDEIRNVIEDSLLSSFEGGKKVYVINNIDLQPEKVQNKLLKTLEEPHEDVIFLLTAASPAGILATVQSRVKTITLYPFATDVLAKMLGEMGVDNGAALARCSGGNFSFAWQLSAEEGYFALVDEVFALFGSLETLGQVCEYIFRPLFDKDHIDQTLQVIQTLFRDLLYYQAGLDANLVFPDKRAAYAVLAGKYGVGCLAPICALVDEARQKINYNCAAANVADSLLAAILEVKSA